MSINHHCENYCRGLASSSPAHTRVMFIHIHPDLSTPSSQQCYTAIVFNLVRSDFITAAVSPVISLHFKSERSCCCSTLQPTVPSTDFLLWAESDEDQMHRGLFVPHQPYLYMCVCAKSHKSNKTNIMALWRSISGLWYKNVYANTNMLKYNGNLAFSMSIQDKIIKS